MILLDTHTLLFWVLEEEKLEEKAAKKINSSSRIGIHVFSCFEIAILAEKDKMELEFPVYEWISNVLSHLKIEIVPLTVAVAVQCTRLPGNFHRDPADRILAATCLFNAIPLIIGGLIPRPFRSET